MDGVEPEPKCDSCIVEWNNEHFSAGWVSTIVVAATVTCPEASGWTTDSYMQRMKKTKIILCQKNKIFSLSEPYGIHLYKSFKLTLCLCICLSDSPSPPYIFYMKITKHVFRVSFCLYLETQQQCLLRQVEQLHCWQLGWCGKVGPSLLSSDTSCLHLILSSVHFLSVSHRLNSYSLVQKYLYLLCHTKKSKGRARGNIIINTHIHIIHI